MHTCVQALLNSSHLYWEAKKHFAGHGITLSGVDYDWGTMQQQKDKAVGGLTKGIEGLFKKYKVGAQNTKGHPAVLFVLAKQCQAVELPLSMQSLVALGPAATFDECTETGSGCGRLDS